VIYLRAFDPRVRSLGCFLKWYVLIDPLPLGLKYLHIMRKNSVQIFSGSEYLLKYKCILCKSIKYGEIVCIETAYVVIICRFVISRYMVISEIYG
jgi:hypothetical protein